MLIIHGEDNVTSRNYLQDLIVKAKLANKEVVRVEGKSLILSALKQAFESQSLFAAERLVVIEGLFSRQQSQEKKQLIDYLISNSEQDAYVWESKQLTAAQVKGFSKDAVREFKLPVVIWQFLDNFAPRQAKRNLDLLSHCLEQQPLELIWGLLIKRLRYLIIAKSGGNFLSEVKELQPWQRQKILSQARNFSLEQLHSLNKKFLEVDYQQKTGCTSLTWREQLEELLAQL